jgi:SAM-dependent methyltransferase
MWRGLAKGALLTTFGRIPGGVRAYRTLTRDWMGTQATHVDKLSRVWPGYVRVWRSHAGLELEGADIWVHEGGWTPFPLLVDYLVTGKAGVVTNHRAVVLDRYLGRAVNGAISCELPDDAHVAPRRGDLEPLRWAPTVRAAIESIDGHLWEGVELGRIPLGAESVDLCHSGGVLEHEEPQALRAFLGECVRILRPGGVMSHVFDHRDHLRHADPDWGFLAHLGLGPRLYALLCGHSLLYHNRLLPSQVAAMFEAAGFERIAVRRMILPAGKYVDTEIEALAGEAGIERARLAAPFREASEPDLRTAAAHYLFRKPAPHAAGTSPPI